MKSISQETTFIQDISNEATLIRTLHELSAGVGFRLREDKLFAKTVKLKLRWSDFTTLSRQFSLDRPTNLDEEIFEVALLLFKKTWENHRSVRLIGVGASGLGSQAYQLSLWEVSGGRKLKLQNALDDLRNRYGKYTIRKGGYGKG